MAQCTPKIEDCPTEINEKQAQRPAYSQGTQNGKNLTFEDGVHEMTIWVFHRLFKQALIFLPFPLAADTQLGQPPEKGSRNHPGDNQQVVVEGVINPGY